MSEALQKQRSWLAAMLLLWPVLTACMPQSIEDHERYVSKNVHSNPALRAHFLEDKLPTLHYVESAPLATARAEASTRAVVFVHGSPGDWSNAGRYLLDTRLRERTRVVSVDRPGWGQSGDKAQPVWPGFADQAQAIHRVIRTLQQQGVQTTVLVGHSLGASILPQVMSDYPLDVSAALLIAGSYRAELGKPRWYNRAASFRFVQWLLPAGLRRSNAEIMHLQENLHNLESKWAGLMQPITVIQGMQDKLVYPANIDFAEANLPPANSVIQRYPELGHLIPFEQPELVVNAVLELLKRATAQ